MISATHTLRLCAPLLLVFTALAACSQPVETVSAVGVARAALEVSCTDNVDDDLDGLVDCIDPDCSGNAACATVFPCDGRALQFRSVNVGFNRSQLDVINTSQVGAWTLDSTFGLTLNQYNGCGYNLQDGFFYCGNANSKVIRKIARNGDSVTESVVGTVAAFLGAGTFAADFDLVGNLWARDENAGAVVQIPIANVAASARFAWAGLDAQDIAYSPDDGLLYGLNSSGTTLVRFNPRTRAALPSKPVTGVPLCEYGSQWFDGSGYLFASCNTTGAIFRIDAIGEAAPVGVLLAQSGAALIATGNDGATCPIAAGRFEICGNGLDDDGDGVTDEAGGIDNPGPPPNECISAVDTDGDGIIDALDLDDDNDGIPDVLERGDSDGDGIPDRKDLDSDGDGIPDSVEAGHATSNSGASVACTDNVGANGLCDVVETGADSAVLAYTLRDSDGDGVPDFRDRDSDGDGQTDAAEVADAGDVDGNGIYDCPGGVGRNGICDALETVADNGLIRYTLAGLAPERARDTDGDGRPDAYDLDSDDDGINDVLEAGGVDANNDGKQDGVDGDGDGLVATVDPGEGGSPLGRPDTDGDGRVDARDLDSDNDGKLDVVEGGVGNVDADGNGVVDGADTDGDGIRDGADGLVGFGDATSPPLPNTDGTGKPDYADVDSDDDGAFDLAGTPAAAFDLNNDGMIDDTTDLDNDGIPDVFDDADDRFGMLGAGPDSDGDGLPDAIELALGTDPNDADSDDDGVPDGSEVAPGVDTDGDGLINALDADSDNDGLFDGTELGYDCTSPGTNLLRNRCVPDADPLTRTSPILADTDGGGARDGAEDSNLNGRLDAGEQDPTVGHGADDAAMVDSDGDGLSDAEEATLGSLPNDADSDDDGVRDGDEPNPAEDTDGDGIKNISDTDSDNDGLLDGTEAGTLCDDPATDADVCVPDADPSTKTLVLVADTDKGGVKDGDEDTNHNGRVDAGERNPLDGSDDNTGTDGGASSSSGGSTSSSGGSSSSSGGASSSGGSSGRPGGSSGGASSSSGETVDGVGPGLTGGACSAAPGDTGNALASLGLALAALAVLRRKRA